MWFSKGRTKKRVPLRYKSSNLALCEPEKLQKIFYNPSQMTCRIIPPVQDWHLKTFNGHDLSIQNI